MRRTLHPLFVMLASLTQQELASQVAYLKKENQILRSRLPDHIRTTPRERCQLLKAGRKIGSQLRHLMSIVSYGSFCRWIREAENRHIEKQSQSKPKSVGRPEIAEEIFQLVLKLYEETGDGYTLLLGRLKKLGYEISRSAIRNILKEAGHNLPPCNADDFWNAFLNRHADVLWQCDFLTKPKWTAAGMKTLFQLVFIHLGTRRIWISPATAHPNAQWMTKQATAFLLHANDILLPPEIVTRDNDGKYQKGFDEIFQAANCKVKPIPPRAPNCQAHVERVIQTYQHECLDQFVIVGERQMNYISREFQSWYNFNRPHSSVNSLPPADQTVPILNKNDSTQDIVCTTKLGGLLKTYSRRAA